MRLTILLILAFGLIAAVVSEATHAQSIGDDYVARVLERSNAGVWNPHGSHSEREEAPRSARAVIGYGVNSLTPWSTASPNFDLIDGEN